MEKRRMPGEDRELERVIGHLSLPSVDEGGAVSGAAGRSLAQAVEELSESARASIIVGREAVACTEGGRNLLVIAALAYILNARINLMSERPNEQGLIDTGCLPDMLPGDVPLARESARRRLEGLWDAPVPEQEGLTLMEFIEAAGAGSVRAMYVMGENPAYSLPDSAFVRKALGRLDFLVVQDIFMTETAEMADVVLPAASWAEKEGTFVNLERRIQWMGKGLHGKAREDWRILSAVGEGMGLTMPYESARDVMAEMAKASPLYSGLTYEDIQEEGALWPYKASPKRYASLKDLEPGRFYPQPPAPGRKPLSLALEKPLFHSGTLSRNSRALMSIMSGPVLRVGRETAERFSLADGDMAEVASSKGSITLPVKIDDVPESVVYLTNTFREKGAMGLFGYTLEPVTKAPVLESSGVRMRKAVEVMDLLKVTAN
jgi:predicted molibdopterin-dependent oxidoreductase YjgC